MSIQMSVMTLAADASSTQAVIFDLQRTLQAIGAAAGGLIVVVSTGVLRPRKVVGPPRLNHDDPPLQIWLIVMIALAMTVLLPAVYVSAAHGKELAALSDEARQQWVMPARDVVVTAAVVPIVSMIVLVFADQRLIRGGVRRLGLRRRELRLGVIAGVIGALAAIPITMATSELAQWVWSRWSSITPQEHQLITQLREMPGIGMRLLIVFAAVIAAPAYEELLFRGHLQTAAAHSLRFLRAGPRGANGNEVPEPVWIRWCAILFASLLFAIVHASGAGSLWMIPPLFVLSICFGYVYERTGTLWAPMLVHAAFNGISIGFALTGMGR